MSTLLLFPNQSSFLRRKTERSSGEEGSGLGCCRKEADDKTALAVQKLASVDHLEEENTKLKTALNEANRECSRWKKENLTLSEKVEGIVRRRDDLESYLGSLAKKLYLKLEGAYSVPTGFCVDSVYEN